MPMMTDQELFAQEMSWRRWHSRLKRQANKYESLSGLGSSLENTEEIREALPRLFSIYNIKIFTDVPCGDWNWMQEVDLDGIDYLGLDLNPEVIALNKQSFPDQNFEVFNALTAPVRRSDLILCRDFLFHLPLEWALGVVDNFKESNSIFLLTTYSPQVSKNEDLPVTPTVGWRPINLLEEPFNFPDPIMVVQENNSPACQGRVLGLFNLRLL